MYLLKSIIHFSLLLPLINAQTTTTTISPAGAAESASPLPWPLGNHPYLLSQLDDLCHEYHRLDYLLNHMNKTAFQHNHPYFNLTILPAILANASAEITAFSQNKTLIRLCNRAEEVEKDCFPLVGGGWKYVKAKNITEWWVNSTYVNGTETNVTEVEVAKKNSTLVIICDKWVKAMTEKNMSATDSALSVEDDVSTTTTPSAATASATGSTSGAVRISSLWGELVGGIVLTLVGMVLLA